MFQPTERARRFAAEGAVVVRGCVSPDWIEELRTAIEAHMNDLSPLAIVASTDDDPGLFVEDFCNWERIATYERVARLSGVSAIAAELMQSHTVRLYHDHLLVKRAKTTTRTPWHQDQPYYDVDGDHVISMWLPVDPIPRSSTLEFIAGSHRLGWCLPRTFRDRAAKWFPEGSLRDVPDIESDRNAFPILGWDLDPGDALFFHALTLHGAAGAASDRRVLSLRFLGDDARFAPRPWTTSPPTHPDVSRDLRAGDPMHHPRFPSLPA